MNEVESLAAPYSLCPGFFLLLEKGTHTSRNYFVGGGAVMGVVKKFKMEVMSSDGSANF